MWKRITLALLGTLLMSAAPTFAQDNSNGPGAPGPDNGPGGPPDFAQMRQRMEEMLKERLGATDDEWSVLQPKIEAVQKLQHELHPRPDFGPGGPRGNGDAAGPPDGPGGQNPDARGGPDASGPGGGPPDMGPGGPNDNSPLQKAVGQLNDLLRTGDPKPDDVKAAMAKVRDERTKVRADLVKAQSDLKSVVSTKQEAVLLTMGILE